MVKIIMRSTCAWSFNHLGEALLATKLCTLPGAPDGGIEWFNGPEPPVNLALCDDCSAIFISQNGGLENVRVEALSIPVPEGSLFSPPGRETQRF